jgi:hypothetical protein
VQGEVISTRTKNLTTLIFWISLIVVAIALFLIFNGFVPVGMRHVSLTVTFKLTDPNYQPLAGVPIRLVFPCDKNWQDPDSGYRFVTDANGEGHVTAQVVIDRRWRKMASNYIGSLIGLPMLTDHLAAGAEMQYMDHHWVYINNSVLFPEGTCMREYFSVYTRDEKGRFSRKAIETNNGWIIKDLNGLMISNPGFDVWDYALDHDESSRNWTLKLAFKKFPPAVMR